MAQIPPRVLPGEVRAARIDVIDGARGAAMLVVFFAHFADAYYGSHPRHQFFILVTRLATPAFVFLSGVMLGLLHGRRRSDFAPMRDRLIDRGLFLLLVGHPLVMGGVFFKGARDLSTFQVMFVTDTLGVCLILGAVVIDHVSVRLRLWCGANLLVLSWVLVLFWLPSSHSKAWWLKDVLTADWRGDGLPYKFPLLPWFGLYLLGSSAGSVFGDWLGDPVARRRLRARLLPLGLGAVVLSVAVRSLFRLLADLVTAPDDRAGLLQLGSLTQKLPPGPGYMLFYGGLALVLFWGVLAIQETARGRAFNGWTALFGRSSLACFIAQFYVYYLAVYLLPKPPELFAPLYFLATVALLRAFATQWDRRGANRLITVGFPARLASWRSRMRGASASTTR